MKFKFNKDWSGGTYVPPGSQMATRRVDFKQGQVVEGSIIRNERNSEPPNFVVVNTSQGTVHIPFGGRGDIIEGVVGISGSFRTGEKTAILTSKSIITMVVSIFLVFLLLYFVINFIEKKYK